MDIDILEMDDEQIWQWIIQECQEWQDQSLMEYEFNRLHAQESKDGFVWHW